MATTRLEKHQTPVFIDVSKTLNGSGEWTPSWKRVELSTIFALNPNPQTETLDFIAYEAPVEEITKYQPELPLECATYEGDPAFDFLYELYKSLPVVSAAYVAHADLLRRQRQGRMADQENDHRIWRAEHR